MYDPVGSQFNTNTSWFSSTTKCDTQIEKNKTHTKRKTEEHIKSKLQKASITIKVENLKKKKKGRIELPK